MRHRKTTINKDQSEKNGSGGAAAYLGNKHSKPPKTKRTRKRQRPQPHATNGSKAGERNPREPTKQNRSVKSRDAEPGTPAQHRQEKSPLRRAFYKIDSLLIELNEVVGRLGIEHRVDLVGGIVEVVAAVLQLAHEATARAGDLVDLDPVDELAPDATDIESVDAKIFVHGSPRNGSRLILINR